MPKKPKSFRYQSRRQDRREWDRGYLMRKAAKKKTEAVKIRNSVAWQNARELARARHPVCCDPLGDHEREGRVEATVHIHHIEPVEKRPDLAFEPLNLAPVCVDCHTKIEAMERRKEATAHLFAAWIEQARRAEFHE